MKVSGKITVTLTDSDGDARFVFRAPKMNELLAAEAEAKKIENEIERSKFSWGRITKDLIEVSGLEHEGGEPVTIEEIKDLALPISSMLAILAGYNEAVTTQIKGNKEDAFTKG